MTRFDCGRPAGWTLCDRADCATHGRPVSVRTRLDNLSPLQVDHLRNVRTVTGGAARAGKTAAMPPTVTREVTPPSLLRDCPKCKTRDWSTPHPCTVCGADKPPGKPRRGQGR